MTPAAAYLPDRRWGPGLLSEVELEVVARGPAELGNNDLSRAARADQGRLVQA